MKFLTSDIEAYHWIHLVGIGLYDGEEFKVFSSIETYLSELSKRKYWDSHIYFHFGGGYDFLFFFEKAVERWGFPRMVNSEYKIIAMKFYLCGHHSITFRDSFALLPSSLEKLMTAFHVEHKKLEFDFSKRFTLSEVKGHLENDCKGLYEVLKAFFESDYVQGEVKYTIASQALNLFRRKYLDISIVPLNLEEDGLFRRKFYSAARVEVYKGHGKHLNYYDINSLYPYAMLSDMPVGECFSTRIYHKGFVGFYECKIKSTPQWYISPLMMKGKKNYFVNGAGVYYLTDREIDLLRADYGLKIDILSGFYFKQKVNLFEKYVRDLYSIKVEAKVGSAQYELAKLFLNSLYGKFAQKLVSKKIISYQESEGYDYRKFKVYTIDDDTGLSIVELPSRFAVKGTHISAYITALARLEHFKYLRLAPEQTFYCDTDSIVTSSNIYDAYLGKEIGLLKKEYTDVEGVFLLPKTYALRGRHQLKLVAKGFVHEDFDFNSFLDALKGKPFRITGERMLKFFESMHRVKGITDEKGNLLKVVHYTKEIRSEYDKRKVRRDAHFVFDTEPYFYSELV